MMAVKIPASGLTPEAMAKAMASGSATMPTVRAGTNVASELSTVVALQRIEQARVEAVQLHGRLKRRAPRAVRLGWAGGDAGWARS